MNRLLYAAKRAAGWLGQLLHPRACVLCRKPLPAGTSAMLCGTCAPQLYHTYRNTAPVRVPGTDGADAPLLYTGALATAMKRYKFYRSTALCRWFSAQAAACLAGHLDAWQPDCLAYVPLGAARWWSRGFNQSEAFARASSRDAPKKSAGKLLRICFSRCRGKLFRGNGWSWWMISLPPAQALRTRCAP